MPIIPGANSEEWYRHRKMGPLEHAIWLANRALDDPTEDPDSDLCIVSRQLLRAIEREDRTDKMHERHLKASMTSRGP